ncbi:alkaline phosphatase [Tepidiforma sp.]|jgi:phosphodiesterase/alkaline phosphatase D-like protein|uniref:alkaline phosphatase D family protein n=1 Tax=Tepidiforma sp. TaxID=2682230 RepID=UPI0026239B9A|nr:alkaline phosphatase D family protein [Tepidiforma sp.]MCX7617525.1 alkaline phosphatase family protein [Tepidiforma sp.]
MTGTALARGGALTIGAAGVAFVAAAGWQRAGEFALLERPWDASALTWAALVGLAGCGAGLRSSLGAALLFLAAAWSVAVVASLGTVEPAGIAGAAFLAAAGLALAAPEFRNRPRTALAAFASLAAVAAAATFAGVRVHDVYLGPTHPASPLRAAPVDLVEWAWAGGVTSTSFAVTAQLADTQPADDLTLVVRSEPSGEEVGRFPPASLSPAGVARFDVAGLQPATRYRWAVAAGGREDRSRSGSLTTLPAGRASFTLAFGSCASTGSNGQVFDRIREAAPLLFIHTGDFHYEDIDDDAPGAIRAAFARSLRAPAQQALWLDVPILYTWDDHDYGGDDSDRTTRSRAAARAVYREIVPHYSLPLDGPIAQAVTVGRVRVIVTDSRSERDPSRWQDGPGKSMLGEAQLAWLFEELLRARGEAALIIWVNSVPWISSETGSDSWAAYADERRRIADFLVEHRIDNLVMLSGDAHMLAADDGSNNRFASDGSGPGFPVYHAAALDRRGSVKGGPYSEGVHPGGGHFGLLTVDDLGPEIRVTFSGRDWRGAELLRHERVFTVAQR